MQKFSLFFLGLVVFGLGLFIQQEILLANGEAPEGTGQSLKTNDPAGVVDPANPTDTLVCLGASGETYLLSASPYNNGTWGTGYPANLSWTTSGEFSDGSTTATGGSVNHKIDTAGTYNISTQGLTRTVYQTLTVVEVVENSITATIGGGSSESFSSGGLICKDQGVTLNLEATTNPDISDSDADSMITWEVTPSDAGTFSDSTGKTAVWVQAEGFVSSSLDDVVITAKCGPDDDGATFEFTIFDFEIDYRDDDDGVSDTIFLPSSNEDPDTTAFVRVTPESAAESLTFTYEHISYEPTDESDEQGDLEPPRLNSPVTGTEWEFEAIETTEVGGDEAIFSFKITETDSQCYRESNFNVRCGDCSSCGGSVSCDVNSAKYKIADGAGKSFLQHRTLPSDDFYNVSGIHYPYNSSSTERINDENGVMVQVKNRSGLYVFNQTSANVAYSVEYYVNSDFGPKDSEGLYVPSGSPEKTVLISNPNAGVNNHQIQILELSKTGYQIKGFLFSFDPISNSWTLANGYDPISGTSVSSEKLTRTVSGPTTIKRRERYNQNGVSIYIAEEETYDYPFGTRVVRRTLDPDNLAKTTTYDYYTTPGANGYSHLKSVERYNGSWERHVYNSDNLIVQTVTPFLNSQITDPNSSSVVTDFSYSPIVGSNDDGSYPNTARYTSRKELGNLVSERYRIRTATSDTSIQVVIPGSAWNDSSNLVSVVIYGGSGNFSKRPTFQKSPAGVVTLTQYEELAGGSLKTTVDRGEPNLSETAILKGTRTISLRNSDMKNDDVITIDIESGIMTSRRTVTERDSLGRETRVEYLNGTYETMTYTCCGLKSRRNQNGVVTNYVYDDSNRLISTETGGVTRKTVFNGYQQTGSILLGSDSSSVELRSSTYDLSGFMTSSTSQGVTTSYSETQSLGGGLEKTTTDALGNTTIQTQAKDGRLLSIGGTGTYPSLNEYRVEFDASKGYFARINRQTQVGPASETTEWIESFTDPLGRVYKTLFADGSASTQSFDALGNRKSSVSPDGETTLFENDITRMGTYVAIDMDGDYVMGFAGTDRITRTLRDVTTAMGTNVIRTRSYRWQENGVNQSTLLSTQLRDTLSQTTWTLTSTGNSQRSTIVTSDNVVVTTTLPDGQTLVNVSVEGRQTHTIRYDAATALISKVSVGYDLLGRRINTTDLRGGNTTIHYDLVGRVSSTSVLSDNGLLTTTTTFDSLNRPSVVTQADGTIVNTHYHPTGEVKRTWGSRTTPVEYTYDRGRIKTMTTWKDFDADSGKGITTWNYDPYRGHLTSKVYDDGKSTLYTYTNGGKLKTRTSAGNVVTTYDYGPAGDMTSVLYSDNTPTVGYSYDRVGRQIYVGDSSGTRTRSYDPKTSLLLSETTTSGPRTGLEIVYTHDQLGRVSTRTASLNGNTLYSVSETYDDASRLETITSGSDAFNYSYDLDSSLIDAVAYNRSGSLKMTIDRNHDLLGRVSNIRAADGTDVTLQSFAYTYNNASQRTRVDNHDGTYWVYTYDELGQVETAIKFDNTDVALPGFSFDYSFDDIGNRTQVDLDLVSTLYGSNSVNQYTIVGSSNLTYDDDGNLVSDGDWNYVYNGENRLVEQTNVVGDMKLKYAYDAQGRRWKKEVLTNSGGGWMLQSTTHFIYDGWNLIAELDSALTLQKTFFWGTDLSGSRQGAGGVGGLLSQTDHVTGTTLYAIADGNGNVKGYVDADSGALSEVEYSPFAEVLAGSVETFGWSSKYTDDESGLVYYGFRYYSSEMGRWLNRDPIGERGGLNVYGFVGNDGLNKADLLGLFTIGRIANSLSVPLGNDWRGQYNLSNFSFRNNSQCDLSEMRRAVMNAFRVPLRDYIISTAWSSAATIAGGYVGQIHQALGLTYNFAMSGLDVANAYLNGGTQDAFVSLILASVGHRRGEEFSYEDNTIIDNTRTLARAAYQALEDARNSGTVRWAYSSDDGVQHASVQLTFTNGRYDVRINYGKDEPGSRCVCAVIFTGHGSYARNADQLTSSEALGASFTYPSQNSSWNETVLRELPND